MCDSTTIFKKNCNLAFLKMELLIQRLCTVVPFARSCQIVFQRSCTNNYSATSYVLEFWLTYFLFSSSKFWTHLVGIKWYVIVILIYISLIIDEVEHFLICVLVKPVCTLVKCLFRHFAHFSILFFHIDLSEFFILDTKSLLLICVAYISASLCFVIYFLYLLIIGSYFNTAKFISLFFYY